MRVVNAFLAMGGYGEYVWLAFGATLVSFLYQWLRVRLAKRRLMRFLLENNDDA